MLTLVGCPWIAGGPPGELDSNTDSDLDTECLDADLDGVCDHVDTCIDGIDDTVDNYLIEPGGSLPGKVCGGDDTIAVQVDAGCTYSADVQAEPTVGVELIEDSYIRESGQAPLSFSAVSGSFDTWEILLFGQDSDYVVSTTEQCPTCGSSPQQAMWGETISGRLCPDYPSLTVTMRTVRPQCDYGINVVTSDQTTTTLYITDDISEGSVSGRVATCRSSVQ